MSVFLESFWPAVIGGVLVEVALFFVLLRTGNTKVFSYMAAVLLLVAALVLLERLVVTDREAIGIMFDATGRALLANDPPAVLANFSNTSPRRQQVESVLTKARITEARITSDVTIKLSPQTSPPSASADFIGRFSATERRGNGGVNEMPMRFSVDLRRENGRWVIVDFNNTDLIKGK